MIHRETLFIKDLPNKKITVTRTFEAGLGLVWSAWTESKLLDQWWAPKPYKAETKTMDFREGGYWLYAMVSPEGERSWCKENFRTIQPFRYITNAVYFCDEEGVENMEFPAMYCRKEFQEKEGATIVHITITFDEVAHLETIVSMGFQEGFTAGLDNLEHYLSTRFQIRRELKTESIARVTTYLNFPRKTEEAFVFYREVFNGCFIGKGLQRFGDIVMPEDMPPMSEADKKLIIHAELSIMGGHILMATDSPESMGFKMEHGNNMHINLEPDSREETERLFHALSAGGVVTMPLQDMFWGAYFASFTDRYGINWMLNYQQSS